MKKILLAITLFGTLTSVHGFSFSLFTKEPIPALAMAPLVEIPSEPTKKPLPALIPPITITSDTPVITSKEVIAPKEITTIIWDLSFTLIETSKIGLASEIGLGDCLFSTFFGGKGVDELRMLIGQILEKGSGKQTGANPYLDDTGKPMPTLMVDWFRGKQTPEEIYTKAKQHIHDWDIEIGFDSPREKRIIEKAIETVIDPRLLAKHTSVIQRALKIVEECANKKDAHGKQKYKMIILGNWEKTAFDLFAQSKEGKKLMKFFAAENIILSGSCGLMKPDKEIFEHLIKEHTLDPETCIFIDDQEANIATAQACNFKTIHLHNGNYKKVRQELKKLKIL